MCSSAYLMQFESLIWSILRKEENLTSSKSGRLVIRMTISRIRYPHVMNCGNGADLLKPTCPESKDLSTRHHQEFHADPQWSCIGSTWCRLLSLKTWSIGQREESANIHPPVPRKVNPRKTPRNFLEDPITRILYISPPHFSNRPSLVKDPQRGIHMDSTLSHMNLPLAPTGGVS